MIRIVQPSVPSYRIDFFSRLFEIYKKQFVVYASLGFLKGISGYEVGQQWFSSLGPFRRILPGFQWQADVLSIPIKPRDIVILCGAPRNLAIPAMMMRCKVEKVPVIWWGHLRSPTSSSIGIWTRLQIMQFVSGLLFYTDSEVEEYQNLGLVSGSRRKIPVAALSNGINVEPIEDVREPYDALDRGKRLLFFGRLDQIERLSIVLRALAGQENRSVRLEVIGDGVSKNRLETIAQDLGISDRVTWHSSLIDESKIAKVANRCAGFVYGDAVGLSLIHTMAYGLPCIVHNNRRRHGPEIAAFREGVTGFSFARDDDASLVVAIEEFFSEPKRLNQMSANCIEITTKRHNTRVMAERFQSFLLDNFNYGWESL